MIEPKSPNTCLLVTVGVTLVLFGIKMWAYLVTGSAAIFSDAAMSSVHLVAIAVTLYGLYSSQRSVDESPSYSISKVSFLAAGFEGAMMIVACLVMAVVAVLKWMNEGEVQAVEMGAWAIAVSFAANALWGAYLVREGKRNRSHSTEASGKHFFMAACISLAVVVGLLLLSYLGISWIDPLFAILVACFSFLNGLHLMRRSFDGIMDKADPVITQQLTEILSQRCAQYGIRFGRLSHRKAGDRHKVDLHLLFPVHTEIGEAHRIASEIEIVLISTLSNRAHIHIRLESMDMQPIERRA